MIGLDKLPERKRKSETGLTSRLIDHKALFAVEGSQIPTLNAAATIVWRNLEIQMLKEDGFTHYANSVPMDK